MNTIQLSNTQRKFLLALRDSRDSNSRNSTTVSRDELLVACKATGLVAPPNWIVMDKSRRLGRGLYQISEIATLDSDGQEDYNKEDMSNTTFDAKATILAMTNGDRDSVIPPASNEYVPWGHFNDIESLISTGNFVTLYITGLSGNGKTTMVEQVCAKLNRECFRVNIINTTDEDDLFGGLRLVNGDTVWQDGAVITAMRRGGVLLLDEVDLGSDRLLCLQPVLEGKGVYIKKKNEWVVPAPGFCIVATANTKGKGSEDGRFVGTNVMNEAFLDRFDYTFEQDYAPKTTEKKILSKALKKYGIKDDDFVDHLVNWADMARVSYRDGGVQEVISTRRLLNICKAYSVFKDKNKSVLMSLARFDAVTQEAFMTLYKKLDKTIPPVDAPAVEQAQSTNEPPF
jgi:MoxR-like ATPase